MLNLLSININGLNDRIKRTALVDWLKCMKVDVACLQETHAPLHESIRKWFANSGFRVVSSSVSNKCCGTAILIKDCFSIKQADSSRFLLILERTSSVLFRYMLVIGTRIVTLSFLLLLV